MNPSQDKNFVNCVHSRSEDTTHDEPHEPAIDNPEPNHVAKLLLNQSVISKTVNVILNKIGCDIKVSPSAPTEISHGPQAFYPGFNDRVVLLSGSREALTLALDKIIEAIRSESAGGGPSEGSANEQGANSGNNNNHVQMDIRFVVPNSTVSLIIGKAGSRIKQLRDISGAKIQVSTRDNSARVECERIINISGFCEQLRVATGMVVQIIQEDPALQEFMFLTYPTRSDSGATQPSLGRHFQLDQTGVGHVQSPEGIFIISPTTGQPLPFNHLVLQYHTEIYLQINDNFVGCLVGRSGQHLGEIRSCSGAKISISQRDQLVPGTRDRLVTVSGPFRSVHVAHLMIIQRLAEIQEIVQRNEMGAIH